MGGWSETFRRALVSGSYASVTSSVALAALARSEGAGALQPVNATSHWLNGETAASFRKLDLRHTAFGYATHHAATVFWAVFFERGLARRRVVTPRTIVQDALIISAVAAAVDYGATPERFTPGWEFVLSKGAMAATYLAMAAGLAAGSFAAGEAVQRAHHAPQARRR